MQCGRDISDLRSDALFCRQRCKRRYYRRAGSTYSIPPSPASTGLSSEERAEERWRKQLAQHEEATRPLTAEELAARALQRRNPGTLVPFYRDRELARAKAELAERQAALKGDPRAIRVEDPYDRSTIGSVARMGQYSRAINHPGNRRGPLLRPGPPGHDPYDQEAECIDAPEGWRRGSRF
jgi:hypothetical protein